MKNNYYNKKLHPFARTMRNHSTKAEIRLWCELLRNKQMMGYSFLRQRPIGSFIADFFCKELKLVIETDGFTHHSEEATVKDMIRDAKLRDLGFDILRFADNEVMNDILNVKAAIESWILQHHPPTPFKGGNNPKQLKTDINHP